MCSINAHYKDEKNRNKNQVDFKVVLPFYYASAKMLYSNKFQSQMPNQKSINWTLPISVILSYL